MIEGAAVRAQHPGREGIRGLATKLRPEAPTRCCISGVQYFRLYSRVYSFALKIENSGSVPWQAASKPGVFCKTWTKNYPELLALLYPHRMHDGF